jgi:ribA/ribD-fused uncharacterized protein
MSTKDTIEIPYYETSYFCLSNFSAHAIEFQGVRYATAEHAFHAQKFDDAKLREQIKNCGSPLGAWEMGRRLKPQRRSDWDVVKVGILTEILREKVKQHSEVRTELENTGSRQIIEVNPNDDFWGAGADGSGQNQTGKILMRLRDEISQGIL